jgi:hypothetical protein
MLPSKRLKLMKGAYATRINTGAVSPMIRARARATPVSMPESAVGMTTLMIVFHLGTPRAYDASRRSSGTIRSISSDDRTTTGTISRTSASDTAKALRSKPKVAIHTA